MSNSEKKDGEKKGLEKIPSEIASVAPSTTKKEKNEQLDLELVRMQVDGLSQIMLALQKNFTVMSQVVSGLEKKMNSLVDSINLTQHSLNISILDILNQGKKIDLRKKGQEESNNQSK